ncbi:MAG: tripartite tricarboxylate transporter substrate binding protein [Alphaproteobacteria bacterium]|nr:tripartite tricarboxylate transporter substrate binding protein [Alphaproteobacteria bacterium]
MIVSLRSLALGAAAVAALSLSARAQDIPDGKLMRLIVPYAAGGTTDIMGRKLAQQLGDRLGRQVIVENRGGAGGSIGTEAAVRGDADGTTLLLHSGAIATEPALKSKLPYDATKDLTAVITLVKGPFALVVNNQFPAKNTAELLAHVRANPGKVNFGTPGPGTSVHLASEYFQAMAKISITHVPYRGSSAALTALLSNEVQMLIDPVTTSKKFVEAGQIRGLAVTTAQRTDLWPGMPTIAESGLPGYEASVWFGVFAPVKVPAATVARLNKEMVAVLQSEDMRKWLAQESLEAVGDSPAEARDFLSKDIERWKALVKSAGIPVE